MRDHTKLKELILYIAEKCQHRPNYGATMINKILFFADFYTYYKLGDSITGEEYFKLNYGPAPKYFLEARNELEAEGLIAVVKRPTFKGDQHRIVPIGRESNLSIFKPEHIAIVDSIIEQLKDEDAESVSGLSHKFYGWQTAKYREVIPYPSVFLREPKPKAVPDQVRQRIEEIIQRNVS